MIDLGDDDPQVAEILDRALFIVQRQIDHLMQQEVMEEPLPKTSEIYRLKEV